jgi:outer membrane murein-binding lipoprotein Lpp
MPHYRISEGSRLAGDRKRSNVKKIVVALVAAVLLVAGCSSSSNGGGNAGTVRVLYAASLAALMERELGPAYSAATGGSTRAPRPGRHSWSIRLRTHHQAVEPGDHRTGVPHG